MREKGRAAIYTMAAFYLLYLAYQMFGSRMENEGTNYALMMFFSVLFVVLSAGLVVFSVFLMKTAAKKEKESKDGSEDKQELKK